MSGTADVIDPKRGAVRQYHDAKHRVFLRMYDDRMAYRALMDKGVFDHAAR